MKIYRQGDVLLMQIDKLPGGLREKDKILAHGEVTGHKHQFRSKQVQVFADEHLQQFVQVQEPSMLEHEEHQHLKIPKGNYRILLQREWDLIEQTQKQIMD